MVLLLCIVCGREGARSKTIYKLIVCVKWFVCLVRGLEGGRLEEGVRSAGEKHIDGHTGVDTYGEDISITC